jgi:hypothetical protein
LPDRCSVEFPFGGLGFFGHDGGVTDIPCDLLRAVTDISCDLSRRESPTGEHPTKISELCRRWQEKITVNCSSYFLRNLLNMSARKIDFRDVADNSCVRLACELLNFDVNLDGPEITEVCPLTKANHPKAWDIKLLA